MQKLTLKEAIAQGYQYCGRKAQDGYGSLISLSNMEKVDFEEEHGGFLLADKETNQLVVGGDEIRSMVADYCYDQHSSESSNDDAENISEELKDKLTDETLQPVLDIINEHYSKHWWAMLTTIELVYE